MTDLLVSTKGLTPRFGEKTAVDNLDLEIRTGQIYGFLGPNGCGKTTTMRMLTGLLTPSSGSVSVLGRSMPEFAEPLKNEIGDTTQIFSYYRDMTVLENLRFAAEIYGMPKRKAASRIDELLETYDLTENINQLTGSMSGGQRQKLALAATVMHSPKLLFLDEPTSAVDPETRRSFWEQLFDLVDQGATMIVSTHFMDEAERCHRLAILEDGAKKSRRIAATLDGRTECLGSRSRRGEPEAGETQARWAEKDFVNGSGWRPFARANRQIGG